MNDNNRYQSIHFPNCILVIGVVITLFVSTGYASYATNQSNETLQAFNVTSQTPIIVELKSPCNGASSDLTRPVIVGSVLTLVGVLVAALFTARRDSARAKFEWGKVLFERYEQHYREFMLGLASTSNADQIKEYYNRLENLAFIPNDLRTKVNKTLNELGSNISGDRKKTVRDNLLRDFEQFMQKPWS